MVSSCRNWTAAVAFCSFSRQCEAKFGGTVYANKEVSFAFLGIDAGDIDMDIGWGIVFKGLVLRF